jgi:hypothetical protein
VGGGNTDAEGLLCRSLKRLNWKNQDWKILDIDYCNFFVNFKMKRRKLSIIGKEKND